MVSDVGDAEKARQRNLDSGLRAVLFDFDGTLTPSLPLWLEAYHVALRTFGVTLTEAEVLGGASFATGPPPEPVLWTLQALECAPHAAIMVGDSAADILAGKAAGTRTALFLPDDHEAFHDRQRLRATNPDFIFREHGEFCARLVPAASRT